MQTMTRPETTATWQDRAACRGLDATVFYPADDDDVAVAIAKQVCAQCPVQEACLEHALAGREKNGVWGGCTEAERRRIQRRRRRSA